MDWKAALEALKKLEGAGELVSAVESRITELDSDRYKAIGDSQSRGRQIAELQKTIDTLVEGIEGADTNDKIKNLQGKLIALQSELKAAQSKTSELETARAAAEAAKADYEKQLGVERRRLQIRDAAIASGANATVLETILSLQSMGEVSLELSTAEDGTKQVLAVAGEEKKTLRDFAQAKVPDFLPSLFPTEPKPLETKPEDKKPQLPNGSPNGGSADKSLAASYLQGAGFTGLPDK